VQKVKCLLQKLNNQLNFNMSKRQERKKARGASASRPVRGAEERLKTAISGFEGACKSAGKAGAAAYTKPGSQKHW
jgi:hypothetical protein